MSDSDLKDPPGRGSSPESNSKKAKRWYALYQVVKKSPPNSPAVRAGSDDESTCASLSVLASNLPGADEISLRIIMAKKIEKGSLTPGGGSLIATTSLDDEEAKYSIHSTLLKPDWLKDDADRTGGRTDSSPKGFLVCYGSSVSHELDSFQNEIDEHNHSLNGLLDVALSGLATTVTTCLEEWHVKSVNYVCRAVDVFKHNLARVLHATLINSDVTFEGIEANDERDIRKFVKACNIQWVDEPVDSKDTIHLSLDEGGTSQVGGIDSPIPFFCHRWAGAAHSACDASRTDSAVVVKAVIEEYKLKVIQDVNNVRRLVKKANDDYYAHYKALIFLRHTGNASVILGLLKDESICSDVKSDSVIDILEEFLLAK